MHLTSRGDDATIPTSRRSRLPRGWTIAGISLALLLVFWLDRVTGAAPVQHLYYVPIILSAIRFRTRGGLAAALAAILLYHLANPDVLAVPYAHADVVQVALFVAVGLVTARLMTDARRLHLLAMTDDLTGLHNLRSFEAKLKMMVNDARATRAPLSLLVLDVDHLKALNDGHGHLTGAEAVRAVGRIIAAGVTAGAVACRYGGDEFVVALPRCSKPEAFLTATRLQESVNAAAPVLAGRHFPAGTLSISVGVASRSFDRENGRAVPIDGPEQTGETLFLAADAALYAAKERGRNRVAMADVNVSAAGRSTTFLP